MLSPLQMVHAPCLWKAGKLCVTRAFAVIIVVLTWCIKFHKNVLVSINNLRQANTFRHWWNLKAKMLSGTKWTTYRIKIAVVEVYNIAGRSHGQKTEETSKKIGHFKRCLQHLTKKRSLSNIRRKFDQWQSTETIKKNTPKGKKAKKRSTVHVRPQRRGQSEQHIKLRAWFMVHCRMPTWHRAQTKRGSARHDHTIDGRRGPG